MTQSNAKLFNNVGHALERLGRNSEALEYFEAAAKVQPDDVGAHINVGRALNSLGRLDDAEEAYEQAKALMPAPRRGEVYHTKVIPSHLSVYVNLAVLVARNDSRLEEADTLYRQAISMRGDYAQAYINRGDVLVRMNRSQEAVQVYRDALGFAADNPDLLYNLGAVLAGLNEPNEALQYWDLALKHNPSHHQTLLSSALLIQDLGMSELYPLAISRLKSIAKSAMADEKVFFNLGMLSMDEGLEAEAERWFKQSVRVSPNFRPALFNLALLLSDAGRASEVEPLLRTLLRTHPEHVKGLMLLADLQVSHLGQLEEAERTYNKVLRLDPKNLQAKHNLCVVMAESGRLRLAADCLRAAAAAAPQKGAEYVVRHLRAVEAKLKEQEDQQQASLD